MTGIDELRRTLEVHAHDVHDTGMPGRADAARARARAARRQRNVLVAAAAAVVLAAAATVASWPSSERPVPADRELSGHEAPSSMQSLGYTFGFDHGVEGQDGVAKVTFDRSDEAVLLSWAADSGARVRVTDPNGELLGTQATEFGDFVLLPPGASGTYKVRGQNPALAIYHVTSAASGHTVDGITFRERVGSQRLVAAAIGQPGQTELTDEFEVPAGMLWTSMFCSQAPARTWVHVEFEDEGSVSSSSCHDEDSFDPGAFADFGYDDGIGVRPGETARVRVWVTEGPDGEPVSSDEIRIGFGLYEDVPIQRLAAGDIPELQELDGHVWRLTGFVESQPGDRSLEVEDTTAAPTLVWSFASHTGDTSERTTYNGLETGLSVGTGGGSGPIVEPPKPGTGTYGIRLGADASPRSALALATYERID